MGAGRRAATLPAAEPAQRAAFRRRPVACLQVTQHRRCRVRVTVRAEPGRAAQAGHKVTLAAVAVVHELGGEGGLR